MNEGQLTDRMRLAVTDEPPLGFDPDEVVDRAGRRQRQRRTAFASVGATGAALAVMVTSMVVAAPEDRGTPTGRNVLSEEVPTCGDVGLDGSKPIPFRNPEESIERLNGLVPDLLAEHVDGVEFEPVLDGMRAVGCAPTLMASYRAVDQGWHITVRLSQDGRDRYERQLPEAAYTWVPEVMDEQTIDGSRVRVYGNDPAADTGWNPSEVQRQGPVHLVAATRLDPDGFVVEVTIKENGTALSVEELRDLAAARDLRF